MARPRAEEGFEPRPDFLIGLLFTFAGWGVGSVVLQKLRVVAVGMPGSLLIRLDRVLKMPRGVSYFPIRQ